MIIMPETALSPLLPRFEAPSAELETRLRVSWDALRLDSLLAAGTDPDSSEELSLRARQLGTPRKRAEMAEAVRELLGPEHGPRIRVPATRAPLARSRIEPGRPLLERIAELLEGEDPPPVPGLAMAHLLLENADGALYTHQLSGEEVEPALRIVLGALEGNSSASR
jgi:hypothetical protein